MLPDLSIARDECVNARRFLTLADVRVKIEA
jgi:hypothetical protein